MLLPESFSRLFLHLPTKRLKSVVIFHGRLSTFYFTQPPIEREKKKEEKKIFRHRRKRNKLQNSEWIVTQLWHNCVADK